MSATGRSDVRRPDDFYATPAWCVRRLLDVVPLPTGRWLEPCAGNGAIIRAVNDAEREHPPVWTAVELQPINTLSPWGLDPGLVWSGCDFLAWARTTGYHGGPFDVVLTNPPYSLAREFIDACLPIAAHVVMLLRLNFIASAERHDLFTRTRPDVYVLPNRPSFTGKGTDATEYAWFHWHREAAGIIRVLALTPAEQRRAA